MTNAYYIKLKYSDEKTFRYFNPKSKEAERSLNIFSFMTKQQAISYKARLSKEKLMGELLYKDVTIVNKEIWSS